MNPHFTDTSFPSTHHGTITAAQAVHGRAQAASAHRAQPQTARGPGQAEDTGQRGEREVGDGAFISALGLVSIVRHNHRVGFVVGSNTCAEG
jgi:hypothetical protein